MEIPKITFCIPSKDNLRYLKTCIPSLRKNSYRKDHDIIVFVDKDTDGTVEWLREEGSKFKVKTIINPDLNNSLYGIGKAYDKCIEEATTEIVMVFHADMILGKDADKYALNHLQEKTAVCLTRIEPPLHPNSGEKILHDFGIWPEDFDDTSFNTFVESRNITTKITEGIFAPWLVFKKDILELGGHDPILKSCREDSDIFNRMLLNGFKFKQPWNSLVYHFTGRGAGSFSGDEERHNAWKKEMENSTREFIRKWGSNVKHSKLMHPIVSPKYNIGLVLFNTSTQVLYNLEPWFDRIYIDNPVKDEYLKLEQSNTSFNLDDRIKLQDTTYDEDIIIRLDANKIDQEVFTFIQSISDIISDSGEEGRFNLGVLEIEIKAMKEYQNELIVCK